MLKYLFDPNIQFLDTSGAIDAGGHLEVFLAYTDDAAATYADLSGHALNPQRIPLDSNGRATVAVDDGKSYRLEVYAEGGLLLWTVQPYMPSGTTVNLPVTVKGTENEIDVSESVSAREKTFTVSLADSVKKSISDNANAISAETEAREAADKKLSDDIGVIAKGLETETTERKSEDERLEALIGEKQGTLSDGDNIHIDDAKRINVVNRKTLQVKSPLTAEKLDTALVIGIRDGVFATAEELTAETEARKNGDEQNRSRIDKVDADLNAEIQNRIEAVSKKQDAAYFFNPDTSTQEKVNTVIYKGMDIYSASGSNAVQWQGTIHGGYPTLTRVEDGVQYSWNYSAGNWVQTRKKLAGVPTAGRLTVKLNGTATLSYGDWTFVFSVNTANAGNVNVKNPNVTNADIFSETRTYGNTVRLAGQDLSSGEDIVYCGNGDFNSIPTRIVMDIFDRTEWLELRLMQYTSGSNLVIDYRIGGSNG